jgi:CO/xanthine dehydrogenase FAD-binding subunit
MKPAPFDYVRARDVPEALDLLAAHGPEARILAGGQSLVPMMNFRLARPTCLVDVNGIRELDYVRRENGQLAIGALTRHSTIERSELVQAACPLLAEATALVGHPTIRHRGTLGGSLAHADPAAEGPAALLALEGQVAVAGPGGERTIAARELFVGYCTTALVPGEMLTEVRVPIMPPRTGWAFLELTRRHGDFAIVGVAAFATLNRDGTCAAARLALCAVAPTAVRCDEAERRLVGTRPDERSVQAAAEAAVEAADPSGDLHGSARYKQRMVAVFVKRALERALERAGGRQ